MKGEPNRTVMIYVDSYENGVPTGQFHILSQQEAIPFQSMSQLVLGIHRCLDEENFPQSFSALRTFQTSKSLSKILPTALLQKKGELATFSVRVLYRQNASWQGMVTWVEKDMEEYFRSVLELIKLMDDALLKNSKNEE